MRENLNQNVKKFSTPRFLEVTRLLKSGGGGGRISPLAFDIIVHQLNFSVLYSLYNSSTSFCIFNFLNCYITAGVFIHVPELVKYAADGIKELCSGWLILFLLRPLLQEKPVHICNLRKAAVSLHPTPPPPFPLVFPIMQIALLVELRHWWYNSCGRNGM